MLWNYFVEWILLAAQRNFAKLPNADFVAGARERDEFTANTAVQTLEQSLLKISGLEKHPCRVRWMAVHFNAGCRST